MSVRLDPYLCLFGLIISLSISVQLDPYLYLSGMITSLSISVRLDYILIYIYIYMA